MWPFRRTPKDALPTFTVENTIGTGTRVLGDLKGPGGFRVDGAVEGAVEADGPVVIGEGGSVEGGVRGRDIVVLGRVRGDVRATGHLEIGPKGKVVGDITVDSFRMHKGGVFRGTSRMPGADEIATGVPYPELPSGTSGTPATPATRGEDRVEERDGRRGRTLPPPAGAVPPPPSLAELAPMVAPLSTRVPEPAMSEERLLSSPENAPASAKLPGATRVVPVKRATG